MTGSERTFADRLRGTGLKVTAGRLAVLRLFAAPSTAMTHAEVVDALGGLADRASVFRNLNDLVRSGLLAKHDAGDGLWRFTSKEEAAEHRAHPHFLCDDCGVLRCLPDVEVVVRSRETAPFAVRAAQVDVRLRGRCDACRGLPGAKDPNEGGHAQGHGHEHAHRPGRGAGGKP